VYRVALDSGYEEMVVSRLVVRPVLRLLDRAAAAESRWIAWLGGESPGGRR
jgi:hypothetical protein